MKYRVHIFAVVRVPVDVEAESQEQAILKAESTVDLYRMFEDPDRRGHSEEPGEYAEEIDEYLVDELDENGEFTDADKSIWYDNLRQPRR